MKMENAGFMMNHYWNVLVLPSIRLEDAKFIPDDQGSRHNSATNNLPLGETCSLPSNYSGSYLRDTGLSDTDEQLKWEKFPFSLCGSYDYDISPENNFRFWKQDVCSFSKPHTLKIIYKSKPETLHFSTAVKIYNLFLSSYNLEIHTHTHVYTHHIPHAHTHTLTHIYIYLMPDFLINTLPNVNMCSSELF